MAINAGDNPNGYAYIESAPTDDPITSMRPDYMSGIWDEWIDAFVQTIAGYLSQNGICPPQMTTSFRDTIVNPIPGQIIYNTTVDALQAFIVTDRSVTPNQGVWKTITVS